MRKNMESLRLSPDGTSNVTQPVAGVAGSNQNRMDRPDKNKSVKTSTGEFADEPAMHETKNDFSLQRHVEFNSLKNQCMAGTLDFQMQMKPANGSVQGPGLIDLLELFDGVDEAVDACMGAIAERIVQLGGIAEVTVRVAAARSRLEEVEKNFGVPKR